MTVVGMKEPQKRSCFYWGCKNLPAKELVKHPPNQFHKKSSRCQF